MFRVITFYFGVVNQIHVTAVVWLGRWHQVVFSVERQVQFQIAQPFSRRLSAATGSWSSMAASKSVNAICLNYFEIKKEMKGNLRC